MRSNCRIRPEALDAYLHGMLNDAQQREIETHLIACAVCNEILKAMEAETYALGVALRAVDVPPMRVSAGDLISRHGSAVAVKEAPKSAAALPGSDLAIPAAQPVSILRALPLRPIMRAAVVFFMVGSTSWFVIGTVFNLKMMREDLDAEAVRTAAWKEETAKKQAALHAEQAAAVEHRYRTLHSEMTLAMEKERTLQKLQLLAEEEARQLAVAELKTELNSDRAKHALDKAEWEKQQARVAAERDQLRRELQDINQKLNTARTELASLKKGRYESGVLQLKDDPALVVNCDEPGLLESKTMRINGNNVGWVTRLSNIFMSPAPADATPKDPKPDANARVDRLNAAMSRDATFAAPVAANGRVIVGDGYRGKMMYAFDSKTGAKAWQLEAHDTGLGTPVLSEDGQMVSFTSQSCTIYALDTKSGKTLWSKYLASTVETHPAIAGNLVYCVHPNQGHVKTTGKGNYALTCMELRSGNVKWSAAIDDEIHTSPVVSSQSVYVAMRNGQMSAFRTDNGTRVWNSSSNASCAPIERDGKLFFTQWNQDKSSGFAESLSSMTIEGSAQKIERVTMGYPASYLVPVSITADLVKRVDDYAQGGTGSFESALLNETLVNMNVTAPVYSASWAYVGPRPTIVGKEGFVAIGDRVVSADVSTGQVNWAIRVAGEAADAYAVNRGQPPLTPPAYAGGKLYFGSAWGDVLCMDASSGKLNWRYRLPKSQGVTSEIILDGGKAYAVSETGLLYCLDAGTPDATGWNQVGGSSSRNGKKL